MRYSILPVRKNPVIWGFVALSPLIILMNINIRAADIMAAGRQVNWVPLSIDEISGVATSLLLIPSLIWLFTKLPLNRKNWWQRIPLYLAATLVYGALHTSMMWVSRRILYPLFDLGNYNYGILKYRFMMEYNKQFLWFWVIYAIVLITGFIREKQQQQLKAARLEEMLTQARLQALQMQINPHFLFNTLNMISSTMYEDVAAADKMMANLSDMLRMTLRKDMPEQHALADELAFLNRYIAIMTARFGKRLQIHLDCPETLQQYQIAAFLLQPLVENAIQHSLDTAQIARISITISQKEKWLQIEICDNGPGLSESLDKVLQKGIGLSNTRERIEKTYGERQSFEVRNIDSGGLKLTIRIPAAIAKPTEDPVVETH